MTAPQLPQMVPMQSSNVGSIGYAADGLHVMFKGGAHYVYRDVPATLYHAALAAESIGKFIAQNIRGQYAFRKVEKADA